VTQLVGRRIVVVEDNYFLAMEVKTILQDAGADVVGPFPTVVDAQLSLLHHLPDCAVLDVNLSEGNTSLGLARLLRVRCIPFLFFTGYDAKALPPEFGDVERVQKPVDATHLRRAVERCCREGSRPG